MAVSASGASRVSVKICGMTHPDDVADAISAGADRLGFVIGYPQPVPWELGIAAARALMEHAGSCERVAVVGGSAEEILRIVGEAGVDVAQLHGDEPPAVVETVAREGVRVIKALRADIGQPIGAAAGWVATARAFVDAGAAEILLDSRSADRPAGTGAVFNWDVARIVADSIDVPVVLAGGLHPGNVAEAIATVRPAGVDVISGVASIGDRKDAELMLAFVAAARGARAETNSRTCGYTAR